MKKTNARLADLIGARILVAEADERNCSIRLELEDGRVASLYANDESAGVRMFPSKADYEAKVAEFESTVSQERRAAAVMIAAVKKKFSLTNKEIAEAKDKAESLITKTEVKRISKEEAKRLGLIEETPEDVYEALMKAVRRDEVN